MFNKDSKKELEQISNASNHLGKGTVITGNIESHGNIRIEGTITGDLITKSKVVLGDSAKVIGNVLAQNAEISGEIKGVIEVSEVLILKPSAIITGDIVTNKLVVENGAQFDGTCKMGAIIKEIRLGEKGEGRKERTA